MRGEVEQPVKSALETLFAPVDLVRGLWKGTGVHQSLETKYFGAEHHRRENALGLNPELARVPVEQPVGASDGGIGEDARRECAPGAADTVDADDVQGGV